MSATDTALRVVGWALTGAVGAPPRGDLLDAQALIRPSAALRTALGQLAAVTAARLRLAGLALGELSAGDAVLAAALGALQLPAAANALLQAVPPARGAGQWIARHGLAGPALAHLTGQDAAMADLYELCLRASPYTALLAAPPEQQRDDLVQFAASLLDQTASRRLLQLALAEPVSDLAIRRWRGEVLERLRLVGDAGAAFVLDVYEAMLIYYAEPALAQARQARAAILNARAVEESRLRDALTVADWWGPLWALQRSRPEALRARRYLSYDYREGLALYRLAQRLGAGMA